MTAVTCAQLQTCSVVIPVFNESKIVLKEIEKLKSVLALINDWRFRVICVDDGSTDGSHEILQAIEGITLIRHEMNSGYGSSLSAGIDASSDPWILICDADGTYPFERIPSILEPVSAGYMMIVAVREGPGITLEPYRRAMRWVLRKLVHLLTGIWVPDLNSGMRVFNRSLYRRFKPLFPKRFSFTTTLTVASLKRGFPIAYVPIRYSQRVGTSKIRPLRDFLLFIMLIGRIIFVFRNHPRQSSPKIVEGSISTE